MKMKRILIFLFSAVTCLTANAQFINVYKDGKLQDSYDATKCHVEFEPTNPQAVPTYLFEKGTELTCCFHDNDPLSQSEVNNTDYVVNIESKGNNLFSIGQYTITGESPKEALKVSSTVEDGVVTLKIEGDSGYTFYIILVLDTNKNTYTIIKTGDTDGSDRFTNVKLKMSNVDITDLFVYKTYEK